jgi:hypothetical protein
MNVRISAQGVDVPPRRRVLSTVDISGRAGLETVVPVLGLTSQDDVREVVDAALANVECKATTPDADRVGSHLTIEGTI